VAADDGSLWVFWDREAGTYSQIFYKVYRNGVGWSPDAALSGVVTQNIQPIGYQMRDGRIWVAWSQALDLLYKDVHIYYRIFDGVSWSPETALTSSTSNDRHPALLQDTNGTIWFMWERRLPIPATVLYQRDILFRTSIDNGVSFSPEGYITNDGSNTFDDIQASAAQLRDRIWVFWVSNRDPENYWDLYYSTSDPIPFHDVAAGALRLPQDKPRSGENLTVVSSVWNAGTFSESVNLTITIDGAKIATNLTSLTPWTGATFTYKWGTIARAIGSHTVQALVAQVPGEVKVWNNIVSAGFSIVPQGDTNRDGVVNSLDLGIIGSSFLTRWGDSAFNPQADLNHDGFVNSLDLGIVGSTNGQAIVLPPDFTLNPTPYLLRMAQGSSAAVTIHVDTVSGFASPVFFSASGFGPGLQATFSASPVTSSGTTTLTLVASSTAALGSFSVMVAGAGGTLVRYANFSLVIKPPASFSVALGSSSTLLVQGGNALSTVALSSLGDFGSPVFLSVSGLPAGVSYAFSPNPASPPPNGVISISLNLTATTTVTPGTYAVTVTGNSGSLSSSVTLNLRICTAIIGDVNLDGVVNGIDLGRVGAAFLKSVGQPGYDPAADVNKDGTINGVDLGLIGSNFLKHC
jgi:hypothetical protein